MTSTVTKAFYPPIEPFDSGMLRVSQLHQIYYEQSGNPKGLPVVFLHGGPGGGCKPDHRRYFDPKKYRIILFDQRGCGRSLPFAELQENTTWDLVADIERIRTTLQIENWLVFGGSWGSTLALSYAVNFPQFVTGLILRGIFLCRRSELQWFCQEGANYIFPDVWETFFHYIPESERGDLISAYYKRLTSPDEATRLAAAKVWCQWEMATSFLIPKDEAIIEMEDPDRALPFARIEAHYFVNRAFFDEENYLLNRVDILRKHKIPGVIVQGRYDVVCPMKSAWELHRAWPEAKFIIAKDAGHAASEPSIRHALIDATDAFEPQP